METVTSYCEVQNPKENGYKVTGEFKRFKMSHYHPIVATQLTVLNTPWSSPPTSPFTNVVLLGPCNLQLLLMHQSFGPSHIITSYSPAYVSLGCGRVNTHFHFFLAWFLELPLVKGHFIIGQLPYGTHYNRNSNYVNRSASLSVLWDVNC